MEVICPKNNRWLQRDLKCLMAKRLFCEQFRAVGWPWIKSDTDPLSRRVRGPA